MLKRILLPLDGSADAERAIALAAHVARASGGMLILLRVVGSAIETWPSLLPPLPSAAVQTMIEVGRAEAIKYLEAVARSNHLEDIETRNEVLSGSVASTILSIARSRQVDLIIMSSHGSTGSTRWGLGSVVEKVTRHSPVPVLVLPDGETGNVQVDTPHPLRALVPLDGSPLAEAALIPASQLISALAAPAQGALHIALVAKLPPAAGRGKSPKPMDTGMRAYLEREARIYVTAVVERLHKHSLPDQLLVTWSILFDADVANALIKLAENGEGAENESVSGGSGCDLIVMTTHGRGGAQPWTMGSVTTRVLGATRLPLLIVPCLKSVDNFEPQHGTMPQQEDVSQLVQQNIRLGV
jgi:nucleotide-binding universal stress UspA family protein